MPAIRSPFQTTCCGGCGWLAISSCYVLQISTAFMLKPGCPQGCSQVMLEHSGTTRAGPFLPSTGCSNGQPWQGHLPSAMLHCSLGSSTRASFLSSSISPGAHPSYSFSLPPSQAWLSLCMFPSHLILFWGLASWRIQTETNCCFSFDIFRAPYKVWYMFILLFYSSAILFNPPRLYSFSLQPLAYFLALFVSLSWNLAFKHI